MKAIYKAECVHLCLYVCLQTQTVEADLDKLKE